MEEKSNNATEQRPQGDRTLDAPLVTMDLNSFIEQIKRERAWKESDRNAITVFKTDGMRIVLVALHKGAEMIRHLANGIISLQVLEGQIAFKTDEQSVELGEGQMMALHEAIPHNVRAMEESVFLLTLTTKMEEGEYK